MSYQTKIQCMACDHVALVTHDAAIHPDVVLKSDIFRCDECGARMAFGRLMPRIVVEPYEAHDGTRWVRLRTQDLKTKEVTVVDLDPQYAAMLAKNILSIVVP